MKLINSTFPCVTILNPKGNDSSINCQFVNTESALFQYVTNLPQNGVISILSKQPQDNQSFFSLSSSEGECVHIAFNLWECFVDLFPWDNPSLLLISLNALPLLTKLFKSKPNLPSGRIFDLKIPLQILHGHSDYLPPLNQLWEYYMRKPYPSSSCELVVNLSQAYALLKPICEGENLYKAIILDQHVQCSLSRIITGFDVNASSLDYLLRELCQDHHTGLNNSQIINSSMITKDEEHVFVAANYQDIDLVSAASLSEDPLLLHAINEGRDLHVMTASDITGKKPGDVTVQDRCLGKAVNSAFLYDLTAKGMSLYAKSNYNVTLTSSQAEQAIKILHQKYQRLSRWQDSVWREVEKRRKLKSNVGYIRHFPCALITTSLEDVGSVGSLHVFPSQIELTKNTTRITLYPRNMEELDLKDSWHQSPVNPKRSIVIHCPIQSTTSEITKMALVNLETKLPANSQIVSIGRGKFIIRVPKNDAPTISEHIRSIMEMAGQKVLQNIIPMVKISIG